MNPDSSALSHQERLEVQRDLASVREEIRNLRYESDYARGRGSREIVVTLLDDFPKHGRDC